MKNKDKILHILLLCAFAFQLIFMLMDIATYGFLKSNVITFADLIIIARFVAFVPLCIYEGFKIYKCVKEEKKDEKKRRHRHHHQSHNSHHTHHHHTQFMDNEALIKAKMEEKQKEENK